MKKVFYVMLAVLLASTVSMNAQVRIGNTTDPHDGAVLDLKSDETAEKGVLFPNVNLLDVEEFQLSGDKSKGEGMVIYNTNDAIGKGLYFWNGTKWTKVNGESGEPTDPNLPGTAADWVLVDPASNAGEGTQSSPYTNACPDVSVSLSPQSAYTFGTVVPAGAASLSDGELTFTASGAVIVNKGSQSGTIYVTIRACEVPVNSISVSPASASLSAAGATQALTATVLPEDATNKAVTWTSSNDAIATVDANGLVTAKATGTAIITATTVDGGETANSTITVTVPNTEGSISGSNGTYKTYTYKYSDGSVATWMVENSKEGNYMASGYNNSSSQVNGYYYTWASANATSSLESPCPDGWHLPTTAEWNKLMTWVNNGKATEGAKYWVTEAGNAFAGYNYGGLWGAWGANGGWWSAGASNQGYDANTGGMNGPGTNASAWFSVRCVKN